jgi:hypothetical protein
VVSAPTLRPGKIETKVIHDQGEIATVAPWITLAQSAQPS